MIDHRSFGAGAISHRALLATVASSGIGLLSVVAAVDQPAFGPAVLLVGGFLVGLASRDGWWSSTSSAAIGVALGGWLHSGIVAGRDSGAAALLAVGAVMCLLLFLPAWCLGRAAAARRRVASSEGGPDRAPPAQSTASTAETNYGAVGLTIAVVTVVLFAGLFVLMTRGGGCCP